MTEMITIERTIYDRMIADLEDAEDNAIVAAHLGAPQESIPSHFVDRLLDGDNPISVFRKWRGLSAAELSRESGVNRVQIVDIEAGRNTGSVATLKKLATALGVTIDELVV